MGCANFFRFHPDAGISDYCKRFGYELQQLVSAVEGTGLAGKYKSDDHIIALKNAIIGLDNTGMTDRLYESRAASMGSGGSAYTNAENSREIALGRSPSQLGYSEKMEIADFMERYIFRGSNEYTLSDEKNEYEGVSSREEKDETKIMADAIMLGFGLSDSSVRKVITGLLSSGRSEKEIQIIIREIIETMGKTGIKDESMIALFLQEPEGMAISCHQDS